MSNSTTPSLPLAIVLTDGLLSHSDAKTAHGLIRGTDRFSIAAVIDSQHAGKDAGEVIDGVQRNIPVLATAEAAFQSIPGLQYCIIGVATIGGVLPVHFVPVLETCIRHGLSIVNGLHDYLTDRPEMVALAAKHGASLIDIRRPKQRSELHFWNASIFTVTAPVIAVLGTDCALGKRTTCRMITQALQAEHIRAEMIYTGQTGWMQGYKYGFIFDSTLNDFIAGELEHAVVNCWQQSRPDVILIEGQSALRNPSGPCGSEMLISANAKHVVLVHAPKRRYYDDLPEWGPIHSLDSEVALIKMYGAEVLAVALNTEGCTHDEALQLQASYAAALELPVLLPLEQGVASLVPAIVNLVKARS